MITAILVDRKGFQKSIDIPRVLNVIRIPSIDPMKAEIQRGKYPSMSLRDIIFHVDGWIDEENRIMRYKEED
jgi:hypothetical protein